MGYIVRWWGLQGLARRDMMAGRGRGRYLGMAIRRVLLVVGMLGAGVGRAQVLTGQYDNARSGAQVHERVLTPSNVNGREFGRVGELVVDGDVFAQPLLRAGVVFVATEHDSVYAFEAGSGRQVWKTSFLDAGRGVGTVSEQDVGCPFIGPEVGITSTPVIDGASGTMYVVARTKEAGGLVQRLHALDVRDGRERVGSPVEIRAEVAGTGEGSVGGKIGFDARRENPRAGLLLVGGVVYLTWGSSCDSGPYHGWVMAYDGRTLRQRAVWNVTPDGGEGGIWQSDAGPAADEAGNVYVATGNGDFDGVRDFSDSLVKLRLVGDRLVVKDFFTPFDEKVMQARDWDLGSQGPVLFGDEGKRRVVVTGKEGKMFVLDREKLGRFQAGSDSQIVQTIKGKDAYGAAAYWAGHVYLTDRSDVTREYAVEGGQLVLKGQTAKMERPGAVPVVSADGVTGGVVWVLETKEWNESHADRAAVLHAYDALDLSRELWTSEGNAGRDRAGMVVRFAVPTVAGGRVFVGVRGRVEVYGLLGVK
jgi:outer membrane protein assembly factor BamB